MALLIVFGMDENEYRYIIAVCSLWLNNPEAPIVSSFRNSFVEYLLTLSPVIDLMVCLC